MLIRIHENIFLSLEKEAYLRQNDRFSNFRFISALVDSVGEHKISSADLCTILDFRKRLESATLDIQSPVDGIIVCPASDGTNSVYEACKLLGAYLILTVCMPLSAVVEAFSGIYDPSITHADSVDNDTTTLNCWQALYKSMNLGWIVGPKSEIEPALDVEAFAHYSTRANGSMHMVVPGRMLFFPSTKALPHGQKWVDSPALTGKDGGAVVRHFSPDYYAEHFGDLGVSAVVCLGLTDAAAAAAFTARGIEVVDLGLKAQGASLLHGLDLLLSLAATAPGVVAVHSGDVHSGGDGFAWPAYTSRLVAAFLVSRLGFGSGAATAWIRMLCPWMLTPPAGDADPPQPAPLA